MTNNARIGPFGSAAQEEAGSPSESRITKGRKRTRKRDLWFMRQPSPSGIRGARLFRRANLLRGKQLGLSRCSEAFPPRTGDRLKPYLCSCKKPLFEDVLWVYEKNNQASRRIESSNS